MSEAITQMRLSTHLETYVREYTGKHITRDDLSNAEWNTVLHVADRARTHNTLMPELVDDVGKVLKRLGAERP